MKIMYNVIDYHEQGNGNGLAIPRRIIGCLYGTQAVPLERKLKY